MDDQRLRTIFDAFRAAVNQPESFREDVLEEYCGDDEALKARVRRMLDDQGLSTTSVFGPSPPVTAESPAESVGAMIGPYKLLQEIGEGGFGVVYMAEQRSPMVRRVALKIIKLGMDTRRVVARFEAERQALALMDHPHIARVLDAGATTTGRPYFVMELVKGVPITEFCDAHKLNTHERLDLFMQVCHAVHHAHQKGIIHRDLKPGNVLVSEVDGRPVPKVIDFGIAKAMSQRLTEKTMFTEFRQLIGTPEYMSPEQADPHGIDVDTRSDIYALGVLLYELVTGVKPFDSRRLRSAALNEIQRIIREEEPHRPSTRLSSLISQSRSVPDRSQGTPGDHEADTSTDATPTSVQYIAQHRRTDPSTLARLIRGDLDWIVMKSLEKDRSRRYDSASAMARDIERHLRNEPVSASPPTLGYRLRKFTRRHRGGVIAALCAVTALCTGLAVAAVGFYSASIERDNAIAGWSEAENQSQRAETERLGAITARDEAIAITRFLTDMLTAVDPGEQGLDVTVRAVLDRASATLDTQFPEAPLVEAALHHAIGRTYMALGFYTESRRHLERAYVIRRKEFGEINRETLDSLNNLAMATLQAGEVAASEPLIRRAIQSALAVHGLYHERTLGLQNNLAVALLMQNRLSEAETLLERLVTDARTHIGEEHTYTLKAIGTLANLYANRDRLEQARQLFASLLDVQTRVLSEDHPDILTTLHNLAKTEFELLHYNRAESLYQSLLEKRRRVLDGAHPDTLDTALNLAMVYRSTGRLEDAARELEHIVSTIDSTNRADYPNAPIARKLLGDVLIRSGRIEDGLAAMRGALDALQASLGVTHPEVVRARTDLVTALESNGHADEARRLASGHVQVLIGIVAQTDVDADTLNTAAWELLNVLPETLRDPALALTCARRACEQTNHTNSYFLDTLALAEFRNGNIDQAIEIEQRAIAMTPEDDPGLVEMEAHLAEYLAAKGD